jgi:hypothetical protein
MTTDWPQIFYTINYIIIGVFPINHKLDLNVDIQWYKAWLNTTLQEFIQLNLISLLLMPQFYIL